MYSTAIAGFGVRKEEPSFLDRLAKSPLMKGVVGALAVATMSKPVEAGCDMWSSSSPTVLLNVTDPSPVLFYPLKDAIYTSNNTGNPVESLQVRFGGCVNNISCPKGFNVTSTGEAFWLYCEAYNITADQFTATMQNYSAGVIPPCVDNIFSLNSVAELNNNNSCASYIQMPDEQTDEPSLFTIWQQFSEKASADKIETPEPA